MKRRSLGRSLAPYIGILSFSMTLGYVGGLAARASRDDHQASSSALSRAPEGAQFSSIILGGAAGVSQYHAH